MAMVTVVLGDQTLGSHTISHHPFVVGRDADCDIQIDNIGVSHHHCQFLWDGSAFRVEDLKSTNGTLLNGEKVQVAGLKDGDEVRLGKYKLTFHQAAGEPPPPPKGEEPQSLAGMLEEAVEGEAQKAGDGMKTFQMSADLIRQQAGVAASAGGQRAGEVARSLDEKEKQKAGSKKRLIFALVAVNVVVIIALAAVLLVLLSKD